MWLEWGFGVLRLEKIRHTQVGIVAALAHTERERERGSLANHGLGLQGKEYFS